MNEKQLKTIIIIMITILFSTYIAIAVWCVKISLDAEKKLEQIDNNLKEIENGQCKY